MLVRQRKRMVAVTYKLIKNLKDDSIQKILSKFAPKCKVLMLFLHLIFRILD